MYGRKRSFGFVVVASVEVVSVEVVSVVFVSVRLSVLVPIQESVDHRFGVAICYFPISGDISLASFMNNSYYPKLMISSQ